MEMYSLFIFVANNDKKEVRNYSNNTNKGQGL